MRSKIIGFVLIICSAFPSVAQKIKVEKDARFGTKINVPVKIEVDRIATNYIFYANNSSYYPYTVRLLITQTQNLTPARVDTRYKVIQGRNRLIELKLQDGARPTTYDLNYTYSIGIKGNKVDQEFPYRIPSKKSFTYNVKNEQEKTVHEDHFVLNPGDTVYAMRMGTVVATPDMFSGRDRISDRESLEIHHKDETFMVYENIDPEHVFVKAGTKVLPGEPIGLMRDPAILELKLYQSTGDGFLSEMNILYYSGKESIIDFSKTLHEVEVDYPREMVVRELSKRELKKLEKGQW